MKKILLLTVTVFLFILNVNAQTASNPYFNYKGKLIIIGGGSIPDSLFSFFGNYIGGKDQPVVYIPTATTDEEFIQKGEHLIKFTSRGYTNLSTIHTRDKKEADNPKNKPFALRINALFFGSSASFLLRV